jgi:hypothetical protein
MFGLDFNLVGWDTNFRNWLDAMLGGNGVLRGPLIACVAISIVGYVIYCVTTSSGVLFGNFAPKVRRNNQIAFEGAGTVWGSDRELKELMAFGNYQKLGEHSATGNYVSVDDQGNELSQIRVTRWSSD